jgi:hypothetical protein
MDNLWFEDELKPSTDEAEAQIKASGEKRATAQELQASIRSVVRADGPLWKNTGQARLTNGIPGDLWAVRLRFQFDPRDTPFVSARCVAYLESLAENEPQPIVYDIYPRNLFDGKPQTVSLKFNPSIEVADVKTTIGEISTDVAVGQISPVVVGYTGEEERRPYWNLRPDKFALEGIQTFWLLIQQPVGCTAICLRTRVTGIVQTHWGPIAVGPQKRVWDERPSVVIQ